MPVTNRVIHSASNCSIVDPTTITIDASSGFDARDCEFTLTIKPTGSGTGTIALSWADSAFDTTYQTAKDLANNAVTISLADAVSTIRITGIDLHKLKLTPSAVSGVTAYSYSLAAIGT